MSDLTKTLLNIRSLRAFSRDLTIEQLEEALDKLTIVVEERREQEEQERAANAEREEKLREYAKQIADDGIDLEELIATMANEGKSKNKQKRAPRPAKYKYTDEDGKERTWTGQGRTPKAIQTLLDQGHNLDDFLL